MALNVIMLGPPGAGKGTQAERLALEYGVPKISTGDILREAVQAGTEIGRLVRETMDAGHLVSDEMIIAIVRERLARADTAPGFVLDGFPRTVRQAQELDVMMVGRGPLAVLHLVVPTDQLVRRLSSRRICATCGHNAPPMAPDDARCATCGGGLVHRSDDGDEVVRERLRVFDEQTRPLLAHYGSRPTFFAIDGNQPPDRVAAAMREMVERLAGAKVPRAGGTA